MESPSIDVNKVIQSLSEQIGALHVQMAILKVRNEELTTQSTAQKGDNKDALGK